MRLPLTGSTRSAGKSSKAYTPGEQFARALAECGCRVLAPVLIDLDTRWSGHTGFRSTGQTHREWIYRQAFHMGRHIIGYEVQKVLAAVDWFREKAPGLPIGVAGSGEGGLVAFYAAAADTRIAAALVAGYFNSRQKVWSEPIYRNVRGLLEEFGDAELVPIRSGDERPGWVAMESLVVHVSSANCGAALRR